MKDKKPRFVHPRLTRQEGSSLPSLTWSFPRFLETLTFRCSPFSRSPVLWTVLDENFSVYMWAGRAPMLMLMRSLVLGLRSARSAEVDSAQTSCGNKNSQTALLWPRLSTGAPCRTGGNCPSKAPSNTQEWHHLACMSHKRGHFPAMFSFTRPWQATVSS